MLLAVADVCAEQVGGCWVCGGEGGARKEGGRERRREGQRLARVDGCCCLCWWVCCWVLLPVLLGAAACVGGCCSLCWWVLLPVWRLALALRTAGGWYALDLKP